MHTPSHMQTCRNWVRRQAHACVCTVRACSVCVLCVCVLPGGSSVKTGGKAGQCVCTLCVCRWDELEYRKQSRWNGVRVTRWEQCGNRGFQKPLCVLCVCYPGGRKINGKGWDKGAPVCVTCAVQGCCWPSW